MSRRRPYGRPTRVRADRFTDGSFTQSTLYTRYTKMFTPPLLSSQVQTGRAVPKLRADAALPIRRLRQRPRGNLPDQAVRTPPKYANNTKLGTLFCIYYFTMYIRYIHTELYIGST